MEGNEIVNYIDCNMGFEVIELTFCTVDWGGLGRNINYDCGICYECSKRSCK